MSELFYEPGFSEPNVARDDAYEAGQEAFYSGDAKNTCPYTDDRLAVDWADGWETARMSEPCDCRHCVEAAADAEAFEPPVDATEAAHNLEQSLERGFS